jgi:iron complex outermembrane receptor protein
MKTNASRSCPEWLRLLTGACAALIGGTAGAQDVIAEITVTSQRRAENIQDVPIAVTALTAQSLQEKNISDVQQINNLVPNVNIDSASPFSGTSAQLSAYIRGIGQNDFAFNFDPGVGVYLDGVYLARTVGANVDLLDVERIEVLKGPQGTLFGRNTIGGAISVVTRRPSNEFKYNAEVIGGDFRRLDLRGSADLPLVEDKLLSTFAFSSKRRDGYQTRIPFPGAENFVNDPITAYRHAGYESNDHEGSQNEQNARAKLLWIPNDSVEVTFAADYSNVDQSATANSILQTVTSGPNAAFGAFYNLCLLGVPFVPTAGLVCGPRGVPGEIQGTPTTPLLGLNVDADPNNDRLLYGDVFVTGDPDTTYATGNSFSRVKMPGASLTIDWETGGNTTLKSITAYRDLDWEVGMDLDGSPITMLETSFRMVQREVSQEFQLAGRAMDDRLNWLVGAYYFNEAGYLNDYVTFPGGLLQIYGPNDLETTAYAGFAHVNWRVTDFFGVTVGVRYTKEDKDFEGFQHDLNGFNYKISGCYPPDADASLLGLPPGQLTCQQALGFPDPNDALRYFPPGVNNKTFDDVSPRAGIELRPTEDLMVYASYSEGFKSGSWTTRLSNPLPTAPDFGPENATTYEVGLKSQFADRRMTLNVAAFFTDYEGIQLNFQEGVSPTLRNAGDAEIQGGELEFNGLFTDWFQLAANVGYIDAKYTSIDPGALGVTLDSSLPKTPELTYSISPKFTANLASGARVVLGADYAFRSEVFNDSENTLLLKRPDSENLNASITFTGASDNWDFSVGGTNLTDDRYLNTGQAQLAGGQIYGTYNPPRQWFASIRVRGK